MPLRAFIDSDDHGRLALGSRAGWYVLMPLRAFIDSDAEAGLLSGEQRESLNALTGIY